MLAIAPIEGWRVTEQEVTIRDRFPRWKALRPYVFTEHGAIMVANVLRSKQAIQMSVGEKICGKF